MRDLRTFSQGATAKVLRRGGVRQGSTRPGPVCSIVGPSFSELIVPSAPQGTWYRWDRLPREEVSAALSRRLITGDRMMLAHVYLKKGCVVPKHVHENEQLTYVLEGALQFFVGEDGRQEVVVRAGEVLHLPSNVPHEARALEDTLDVDVFAPPRLDWLNKTDDYLRTK
jgi:unsaturated pyranuronate lyase